MDLEFRDPPEKKPGEKVDHREVVAQLVKRPGAWALVPREYKPGTARTTAYGINRGAGYYAPAGAFQAFSHSEGEGVARVWVRFKGEGEALEEAG